MKTKEKKSLLSQALSLSSLSFFKGVKRSQSIKKKKNDSFPSLPCNLFIGQFLSVVLLPSLSFSEVRLASPLLSLRFEEYPLFRFSRHSWKILRP